MEAIGLSSIVGFGVVVIGLVTGSFLNVVIYRLPREKSVSKPQSFCPSCGQPIPWYLNVPILSYLILRGRCHLCGSRISLRYPLVEAGTAILFLFFAWRFGFTVTAVGFWLLAAALVVVFFTDLESGIIPDMITLPGILIGFVFSLASGHLTMIESILGILAGGGLLSALGLLGQLLFKKESLGGGDIKLAAMLGAFLGPVPILLIFVLAAVLGLLVALVALSISVDFRRKRHLPFAPFLVVSALFVIFYGEEIIYWYWDIFRPF